MNKEQDLEERINQLEENFMAVRFDPVDTLHEGLSASNEELRKRSLKLIGHLPHEQFIEPLFKQVADDPSLDVQREAVEALGSFLHQGQMADYDRSVEVEEDLPEPEGIADLSQQQFQAIRDFMGELAGAEDWADSLRAQALPHYARIHPEEAGRLIDRFYRSGSDQLMEAALNAIARLPESVAIEEQWEKIVLNELSRDQLDARRLAAIEAVPVILAQDAGHQLVRILETVEDTEFRQAAAEALSLLDWNEGKEYLEKFKEDPDPIVREWMEQGLARLEDRYPSSEPAQYREPPGSEFTNQQQ